MRIEFNKYNKRLGNKDYDYIISIDVDWRVQNILPAKLELDGVIFNKTVTGFDTYYTDKNNDFTEKNDIIKICFADAFCEAIVNYFVNKGEYNPEWQIIEAKYPDIVENAGQYGVDFEEQLQLRIEECYNVREVLEASYEDIMEDYNSVYLQEQREFEVVSKADDSLYFEGIVNFWEEEINKDFVHYFSKSSESIYEIPKINSTLEKEAIYNNMVEEFLDDSLTFQYIADSDVEGEEWDMGDYIIHVYPKDYWPKHLYTMNDIL